MNWKYGENLDQKDIAQIEDAFGVSLPQECVNLFSANNKAKPYKSNFVTENSSERVIDYLVDLKESKNISNRIKKPNFVPLASDPFGNYVALKFDSQRNIKSIIFWDHETDSEAYICDTIEEFILKLY